MSVSYTIEKVSSEDIDQLVDLLTRLFSQESDFTPAPDLHKKGLSLILKNPDSGVVFVAKSGKTIIGMVSILYTISTAMGSSAAILEDMFVLEEFRRSGAGRQLAATAIKEARRHGCSRITLLTDEDNHPGQSFYKSLGFEKSSMKVFRLYLS